MSIESDEHDPVLESKVFDELKEFFSLISLEMLRAECRGERSISIPSTERDSNSALAASRAVRSLIINETRDRADPTVTEARFLASLALIGEFTAELYREIGVSFLRRQDSATLAVHPTHFRTALAAAQLFQTLRSDSEAGRTSSMKALIGS